MLHGNLLHALDTTGDEEAISTLAQDAGVRIERIVSRGHRSPDGFWYDQSENEFVLLLTGSARLEIEGQGERALGPGDWLVLRAHQRHRVSFTDPDRDTVWLAVFYPVGPPDRRGSIRTRFQSSSDE